MAGAQLSVGALLTELRTAAHDADDEIDRAYEHAAHAHVAHAADQVVAPVPASSSSQPSSSTDHAQRLQLGQLLQQAGHHAKEGELPTVADVCSILQDLLHMKDRQDASLKAAVKEAADATQCMKMAEEQQHAMHERLAERDRASAAIELQLEAARSRIQQLSVEANAAAAASERNLGSLRHKLATQTHQLKARETETQRLQDRLSRELAERDAAQKQRERQVFQEVHRRAARPNSSADSRNLEIISVYESQRRAMQAELEGLRATVQDLSAELREKENLIARKDAFRSWRTPDEGALLGKLQEARAEAIEAHEAVQSAEARHADQLRAARLAAAEARAEADAASARNAALEIELGARPTVKQLNDARATIAELRSALPGPNDGTNHSMQHGIPAPRQHVAVDSADAIRRDREIHEMGLHTLQTMPHPTILRLLQDSCLELHLQDATLLPAALRKMCRALAALPPMEAFVRDVCTLVRSHDASSGIKKDSLPAPKAAIQMLRHWVVELRKLQQLQDFVVVLSQTVSQSSTVRDASKAFAVGNTNMLPPRDILHAVQELLRLERKSLRALDTLQRADMHLELQPGETLSKLCSHFGRLFEVRSTEGMVPKMNELYLFVNEQTTVQKVIRSYLGLEEKCSTELMLSKLRESLNMPPPEGGDRSSARNDSEPSRAPDKSTAAVQGEGEPKVLPQYVAIAAELRKLMHVSSILAIVPSVKDLIREKSELREELEQQKQVHDEMQALLRKLRAALAVGSTEAHLAQRLQNLVTGSD